MAGGDSLKQGAEALVLAGRWAAERCDDFRAAWPERKARLQRGIGRRSPAAQAWLTARLKAATPRLIAASASVAVCAIGFALIWPSDEPARKPAINAADVSESTASLGEWLPIAKPIALYALESSELPGQRSYEARRHGVGGGREDILSFNDFDDDKIYLVLRLYRPGSEKVPTSSLFVQSARQAALDGVAIERMAAPSDMTTKFGPAETADVALASSDSEARRNCIAFRFPIANGAVAASGFACGPEARPVDRALLACLIDRTALLASNDEQVRLAFARADLHRPATCASPRYAGSPRRTTWLDPAGHAPALKGALPAKR